MRRIIIEVGIMSFPAELNDSATASAVWEALPLSTLVQTWNDEIYAEIPVEMPLAPDARANVEAGDVAYWPMGRALCVFFGPTPASTSSAPKAYSPVNIIGRTVSDAPALRAVTEGASLRIIRDE